MTAMLEVRRFDGAPAPRRSVGRWRGAADGAKAASLRGPARSDGAKAASLQGPRGRTELKLRPYKGPRCRWASCFLPLAGASSVTGRGTASGCEIVMGGLTKKLGKPVAGPQNRIKCLLASCAGIPLRGSRAPDTGPAECASAASML